MNSPVWKLANFIIKRQGDKSSIIWVLKETSQRERHGDVEKEHNPR